MKASSLITSFLILALAMLVSGCGGAGKTTASLEVVNGFLVSANGYDGGLIIYGSSNSGQSFSIPVTGSTSAKIDLPNGTWTFKAVGWNGDNTDLSMKFSNTPFCGSASAELKGGEVSVNLGLSAIKCDADEFASAAYRDAGTFRRINSFVTVKSLLVNSTLTDTPAAKTIPGSASPATILGSLPSDMKTQVKSVKFYALKKDAGENLYSKSSLESKCMMTSLQGIANTFAGYSSRPIHLPSKGTPFGVELYKDSTCDTGKMITSYKFPQGLESEADGDFLFQVDLASENRLILVGTDLKKGYSSFFAHMPYVKCYNGSADHCATTPAIPKPDFILPLGNTEVITTKEISACGTPSVTPAGITVVSCTLNSDGVSIVLDTSGASNSNNYTLTASGENFIIGIRYGSAADREKYSAYKDMIHGAGASDITNFRKGFLERNTDGDDGDRIAYGRLGKVREHLSPAGAMGLFGIVNPADTFQNNCLAVSGTKEISLSNDEGGTDRYRVIVSAATKVSDGSPVGTDTYTCNTADSNASSCAIAYDKKIKIYDLDVSSSLPQMTYVIDCHSLIGKFESNEEEIKGTKWHNGQTIISWNTNPDSNLLTQRYEFLEWNREWEFSGAWNPKSETRQIGRVFKTGEDSVQISTFDFNTFFDGNWNQQLDARHHNVLSSPGIVCLRNISQAATQPTFDYLLTAGSTIASTRATQIEYSGFSLLEMNHTNAWNFATVSAATTTCSSANPIQSFPNAFNNYLINKSLPPGVDSLADALFIPEFGVFLNI